MTSTNFDPVTFLFCGLDHPILNVCATVNHGMFNFQHNTLFLLLSNNVHCLYLWAHTKKKKKSCKNLNSLGSPSPSLRASKNPSGYRWVLFHGAWGKMALKIVKIADPLSDLYNIAKIKPSSPSRGTHQCCTLVKETNKKKLARHNLSATVNFVTKFPAAQ